MPEVTWQVRDEGTAAVIQQFQELTKAEQRAAIAAAGLSDQLGAAGRRSAELKRLAGGAIELAGALGLVTSVSGAISAGMDEARRRTAALIALAKEAQAVGANLDKNRGNIVANDPNLTAAQRATIDASLRNIAPQLGREGAQRAPEIFARIRDKTGTATLDQQMEAFSIAARGTAITGVDDLDSLASTATANIKIQEALARQGKPATATDAQNLLITAGSKAGVDATALAESFIPLINNPGATAQQSAALLGFGTSEGLEAKPAVTAISSLLQKLTLPKFTDTATGTSFELQGDTSFGKLTNLLDRIGSGEINADAGLRAVAGDDQGKNTLLRGILTKRAQFNEVLGVNEAGATGDIQERNIQQFLEANPQAASTLRTRTVAGESVFRQAGDTAGRSAADVAQAIAERRKGLGLISGPIDESVLGGIEKQALAASKKLGGLKDFEARTNQADIFKAFNIGTGSGEDFDLEASQREAAVRIAFATGGEKAALKEVVAQGFITPSDGISGAERAALSESGISDEQLNKLQAAFIEGNKVAYQGLFAALEKTLATTLREAQLGPKKSDLTN